MTNETIDRRTQGLVGIVFLVAMIITLVLAIATFEGTPTILLLITSLLFLGVGIFFLSGGMGSGGGSGGAGDSSQQQQSVVISDGQVTRTVQQGGVYVVCGGCGSRVQEGTQFCPDCGANMRG